jgi:hypothetical protein
MRIVPSGTARDLRQTTLRIFLPPLTITLALLTAATLVLTAAAIAPPPVPAAVPAPVLVAHPATPPTGRSVSELLLTAPLDLPALPRSATVVDLARLIYAPGIDDPSRQLPGPVLLIVESGVLTVDIDGSGLVSRPQQPAQSVRGTILLHTGDGVTLPTATAVALHNAGSAPAVALAVSLFRAGATAIPLAPSRPAREGLGWAPGATALSLGGAAILDASVQSVTIALHRLSLGPDDIVPLSAMAAMVLAVEAGTPDLEAVTGLVLRQTPDGTNVWLEPPRTIMLLPTDAALLQASASVILRNAGSGPVLALVVTVDPVPQAAPLVGTPRAEGRLS